MSKAKIKDPPELARELAYRAQSLRRLALERLDEEDDSGELRRLYRAFEGSLASGMSDADFADAYAQTLAYGLLSARWVSRDELGATGERFTRASASRHMPTTSPFLERFFKTVLEASVESRLTRLLDDIADLLERVDIADVFGAGDRPTGDSSDPVIHFYEPFLEAYAPEVRQARGVFYTPEAVVTFMVRSVDRALRSELDLPLGLADGARWGEYSSQHGVAIPAGCQPTDPVVTVLDPAAGTGTFLEHVILVVHETLVAAWRAAGREEVDIRDRWNAYVADELPHRIHGLEVMAAPYAICHLKLALTLRQTGYAGPLPTLDVRLTNSLRDADALGKSMLVLLGNPPYSGHTANLFADSRGLVERYKYIRGEKIKEKGALQLEKNLQDDYVKFIALCQSIMARTERSVWCFVTNHGFVDGPTLSGVRFALLDAFARLFVLNAHGNVNRGEAAPGGGKDENLFSIKDAGIAISCGIRRPKTEGAACESFYADLWGSKADKLGFLASNTVETVAWAPTSPRSTSYLLNEVASGAGDEYAEFWPLDRLAREYSNGLVTARDGLVIAFDKDALVSRMTELATRSGSAESACAAFDVSLKKGWDATAARSALRASIEAGEDWVFKCLYRPFDLVELYYHPAVIQTMSSTSWHMAAGENAAILVPRTVKAGPFRHVMVTSHLSEAICLSTKTSVNGNCFPLWLYEGAKDRVLEERGLRQGALARKRSSSRSANFTAEFLAAVEQAAGAGQELAPRDVFYYLAALLHSPTYQERYASQIGSAFPRVPVPRSRALVRDLAPIGEAMRRCYDLEIEGSEEVGVRLSGEGTGEILRAEYDAARRCVWINDTQCLAPIQADEWGHFVGDYRAIERWLVGGRAVTRRGQTLTTRDVRQVGRMVGALGRLVTLTAEVDEVIRRRGGWPRPRACG